jgi:hypothetical protein
MRGGTARGTSIGASGGNRTHNCPLGGGRYIHLTTETTCSGLTVDREFSQFAQGAFGIGLR